MISYRLAFNWTDNGIAVGDVIEVDRNGNKTSDQVIEKGSYFVFDSAKVISATNAQKGTGGWFWSNVHLKDSGSIWLSVWNKNDLLYGKNSKISRLILGGFKILKIMIKNLRLLIFLDMERVSLTIITLKGGIKMTIKMIAVDMDGTFLNDEKKYNVVQFNQIFQVLEEKKIKFVVASGNQYFQLRSFFSFSL